MTDDPDRIISVVKLPDGRFAVKNERDISDLSRDDYDQMGGTLALWFRTHYSAKGEAPPSEREEGMGTEGRLTP